MPKSPRAPQEAIEAEIAKKLPRNSSTRLATHSKVAWKAQKYVRAAPKAGTSMRVLIDVLEKSGFYRRRNCASARYKRLTVRGKIVHFGAKQSPNLALLENSRKLLQ